MEQSLLEKFELEFNDMILPDEPGKSSTHWQQEHIGPDETNLALHLIVDDMDEADGGDDARDVRMMLMMANGSQPATLSLVAAMEFEHSTSPSLSPSDTELALDLKSWNIESDSDEEIIPVAADSNIIAEVQAAFRSDTNDVDNQGSSESEPGPAPQLVPFKLGTYAAKSTTNSMLLLGTDKPGVVAFLQPALAAAAQGTIRQLSWETSCAQQCARRNVLCGLYGVLRAVAHHMFHDETLAQQGKTLATVIASFVHTKGQMTSWTATQDSSKGPNNRNNNSNNSSDSTESCDPNNVISYILANGSRNSSSEPSPGVIVAAIAAQGLADELALRMLCMSRDHSSPGTPANDAIVQQYERSHAVFVALETLLMALAVGASAMLPRLAEFEPRGKNCGGLEASIACIINAVPHNNIMFRLSSIHAQHLLRILMVVNDPQDSYLTISGIIDREN